MLTLRSFYSISVGFLWIEWKRVNQCFMVDFVYKLFDYFESFGSCCEILMYRQSSVKILWDRFENRLCKLPICPWSLFETWNFLFMGWSNQPFPTLISLLVSGWSNQPTKSEFEVLEHLLVFSGLTFFNFFEIAAMPFPFNGILVVLGNFPRIFLMSSLIYVSILILYFKIIS